VSLPRSPHAPCSKFPECSLYFWGSCCVAVVEPPISYLESTVPAAACEVAIYLGLPVALVLLVASDLFEHGLTRPSSAMARKKIIGGELGTRAKENGHQRHAYSSTHQVYAPRRNSLCK